VLATARGVLFAGAIDPGATLWVFELPRQF